MVCDARNAKKHTRHKVTRKVATKKSNFATENALKQKRSLIHQTAEIVFAWNCPKLSWFFW